MQAKKMFFYDVCICCQNKIRCSQDSVKLCYKCKHKSKRLAYRISSANYKNNKCEICGLERNTIDDLDLFDFHHTDRSNKSFELGDKIEERKWEDIKKELDKCMMLCANCHRKQHLYTRQTYIVDYAKSLVEVLK
jgi:hypothetical protein